MKKLLTLSALLCGLHTGANAQNTPEGGADEQTPSYSEYFSWINNTNEGATDEQTRINLSFFGWLHDTYGMTLDIYAFDAGAIDGSKMYGSMKSERFKRQFPQGFGTLGRMAGSMGTRLGLWCGPDGFGNTEEEAKEREEMMVSLARDYNFGLFKMDAVCGPLRPEKYDVFDRMMTRVREYCPNFILLNHRLDLGKGTRHSTTYLLGGAETYIDVHMGNYVTATHHRAGALDRKAADNLTRLTEDHGVCLSSCLDYWEDDLILQAFGRELILSPELYGNPWLLRDDEYPQLAYIFNLHRLYRDILPQGFRLDEQQYGPEALSRGSDKTRFLTLRNLSWNPVKYKIRLNEETGLKKKGKVQVRQYHPYIYDMGSFRYGDEVEVEVLPFRAALVKLSTEAERDPLVVSGVPYQIVNDSGSGAKEVKLLGWPGETYQVRINKGKAQTITFPGTPLKEKYHRQLEKMAKCDVPSDAKKLYEATCFAADNNALEVRSLMRSGETNIPQVKAARDAFFDQKQFVERDLWDRNLFDGDKKTGFAIAKRWGDQRVDDESALYIDLGKVTDLDELRWTAYTEYDLSPLRSAEGMYVKVSANMTDWTEIVALAGKDMRMDLRKAGPVRYIKFPTCPLRLVEIEGYKNGQKVDRSGWKANNLFRNGDGYCNYKQAWKSEFTLSEAAAGSYLCIAVAGEHGREGVWAGLKVDGRYVGCPDRAPSYESNTWECPVCDRSSNYTFYVPVTPDMVGKKIETWVLGLNDEPIQPEVWITAYPIPFEQKIVTLK